MTNETIKVTCRTNSGFAFKVRANIMVMGTCAILDGIVYIISLGYYNLGLQMWWINKTLMNNHISRLTQPPE